MKSRVRFIRYTYIACALFLLLGTLFYATNEKALVDSLNYRPSHQAQDDADNGVETVYMLAEFRQLKEEVATEPEIELTGSQEVIAELQVVYSPNLLELNGQFVQAQLSRNDRILFDGAGKLLLRPGETVILARSSLELPLNSEEFAELETNEDATSVETTFSIVDKQRLPTVLLLVFAFLLFLFAISRRTGVRSVLGLIVTFVILVGYIVPGVLAGSNALILTLTGSFFITLASVYLAHGISIKTTLSIISMLICVLAAALLGVVAVEVTQLLGLSTEEALFLQFGDFGTIDLRGVLLGAIVIGALGVLDDVSTAQTAAVIELKQANPKLGFSELYSSATRIGREHITSLVNTLILAYASASFPLFILLVADSGQPLWVTLNSELVVEEIVRSIVGSAVLILAVPISSFIAAYYFARERELLAGAHTTAHKH